MHKCLGKSLVRQHSCVFIERTGEFSLFESAILKVYMTQKFFISLFERVFKMMKNGVYFIVIALLVAKLFKMTCDIVDTKSQKMEYL